MVALLGLVLFTTACQQKTGETPLANFKVQGDTISILKEANVKNKIKTLTLQAEEFSAEIQSTGIVKAIPNLYAEIAAPFSGRVTAVHLRLGLKTKAGTPLFELSSPEFMEAQKLFFQAKSEYQQAGLTLKRQQDLKSHGVGSDKDLEEALTITEVKKKEYQNARASLQLFNVDVDRLVFGQSLIIRSPIAGEVIANDIVFGQYLKADEAPRAKVAELSQVWVAGMVKEKDLGLLQQLAHASISIAAFPNQIIKGQIYHVDEQLQEETRSVQVLIACDNRKRLLKPNMFVDVKFTEKRTKGILIPEKALLQHHDQSYVWLQTGPDQYVRHEVKTGITIQHKIQILAGLSEGDRIVSEGAFYLLDAK